MEWEIGLALLLGTLFLGMPIAFSLPLIGFVGLATHRDPERALNLLGATYFEEAQSQTLHVVPLFILMGNFIVQSGIARELYSAANAWLRHRRGGLAMATVVACGGFASVCGSSLATTATMAKISLPAMREYGYSDRLAAGSIAAGGTLGILIPPSVILIIYGILTAKDGGDIGALFIAGLIPGLLGVIGYMLAVRLSMAITGERHAEQEKLPLRERFGALKNVIWALGLFVFVLGGIYTGAFTATEAAGMGAAGAMLLTIVRRKLAFRETLTTLFDSAKTTAVMFFIYFGAVYFQKFLTFTSIGSDIETFIQSLGAGPYEIILMLVIMYVILGALLESLSMIVLTVPILYPIIQNTPGFAEAGFDLIWFGIFVVVVTELSFITPPIGLNVFVMRTVAPNIPLARIFAGVMPFVAVDLVRLGILIALPFLATWLPETMAQSG